MVRPSRVGAATSAVQPGPRFGAARLVHGTTGHLALWGEVDLSAMTALEREIARSLRAPIDRLVIDVSAVTFLDASALTTVLRAQERCERAGIELRILRSEGVRPR